MGCAAKRPDFTDRCADDLTFFGNHDYLIFLEIARKHFRADDFPGFRRHFRRLDAASASSLHFIFAYCCVLAVALAHHDEKRGIFLGSGGNDFRRNDLVFRLHRNAANPACGSAHLARVFYLKADGLPFLRNDGDSVAFRGEVRGHEPVPFFEIDGNDAGAPDIGERLRCHPLHRTLMSDEEHAHRFALGAFRHRQDRGHLLVARKREEIHDALPFGRPLPFRNVVHLGLVGLAEIGEEEEVGMSGRDEEMRHDVFFLSRDVDDPDAAALLLAVFRRIRSLHVAARSEDEDGLFVRHQVLDGNVLHAALHDFRAAVVAEFL